MTSLGLGISVVNLAARTGNQAGTSNRAWEGLLVTSHY